MFCDYELAGRFGIDAVKRQKNRNTITRGERRHDARVFQGHLAGDRSFSPAVKTKGGEQIWLAGVGAWRDDEGNVLAGDFDAQVHATFRQMERTLERAGGKLQDIVTMTVFTLDVRHGGRFVELRKAYFPGWLSRQRSDYSGGFRQAGNDGRNTGHRRRRRGVA